MKIKLYFDEAGRGPLAGPVLVGCCVPLTEFDTSLFKDSKKLSEKKRELAFEKIKELDEKEKIFYSFGYADNKEIDDFWISKAINIASKRAILAVFWKLISFFEKNIDTEGDKLFYIQKIKLEIEKALKNVYEYDFSILISYLGKIEKLHWIMFDGNVDFWLSKDLWFKVIPIIKWDDKVVYISIASIVAKVVRDNYMKQISNEYQNYHFEKHKWYGTKLHRELIQKYWPCDLHRISFLKNILGS